MTSVTFNHEGKITKKRLVASSCLSVRPSTRNKSVATGRIFTKFYICVFFEKKRNCRENSNFTKIWQYRGADKSLARPGRTQANISVRMAWILFGALPCRKKTCWQLASRCCWNRARPWNTSELVSFLVGLRNYQHLGNNGYFACRHIYYHISLIALRMRNVSDKSCRENQNTHFVSKNLFFPKIVPLRI